MKISRLLFLGALFGTAPASRAQEAHSQKFVPLSQRPLLQIPPPSPYEKEILAFEAADKKKFPAPGGVLFIGSSSIRLWRSLDTDFPGFNPINRGFGGSQISDSVEFAPRIATIYAPSKIIFYAGTNDIQAGKSAPQVFEDWRKFVAAVRPRLPATPITFLSIVESPSREKNVATVRAANALIKSWNATQPNLDFIDVSTPLRGADGQMRLELFQSDRLHLTAAGYAIWREVLLPYLMPPSTPKS